jgi:GTP-binding protein SAR1
MSSYFSWIWDSLSSWLGMGKKARILFLGLDNAGKTTLTHMLRDGKLVTEQPTRHPQGEEIMVGTIKFRTFDMGGHKAARRLWRDYYANVDAIIFIVDSSDVDRLNESAEELNSLLQTEELAGVLFLILGNKIDKEEACSEEYLVKALGIGLQRTGQDGKALEQGTRPLELFMCSVVRRAGYADGFKWLGKYL